MESCVIDKIRFDEKGLVPVICQDVHAKKVRMLAYMNKEALEKTLETGRAHYYSRSRKKLWLKGETSGHYQYVKRMDVDCDGDTLLLQIEQVGGVSCHTGHATCFYQSYTLENEKFEEEEKGQKLQGDEMLTHLYQTILERKERPKEGSYTNYLLDQGENKILKKIGEEATEVIIAAKEQQPEGLVGEIADLMYHLSVLMVDKKVNWDDVAEELTKRA